VSDPQRQSEPASPAAEPRRPHLLRRLYDWVLHWADTRYAVPALALLAFAESSFFPVPPDLLLIAMALGNKRRAFYYATVSSIASVLGGVLGFVIGFYLMHTVGEWILNVYHAHAAFDSMVTRLEPGMTLAVFVAAFSPIPYKVFTIAAGVVAERMTGGVWPFFAAFLVASAVGRAGRFFLVAGLIRIFGERIRRFIDRYFNWCALAFALLIVAGAVVLKYVL